MSEKPWTDRQFSTAMRKAGYKNMGQGCYVHKQTKKKWYAWTWVEEENGIKIYSERWRAWALVRETPPPF